MVLQAFHALSRPSQYGASGVPRPGGGEQSGVFALDVGKRSLLRGETEAEMTNFYASHARFVQPWSLAWGQEQRLGESF
jgi:hypothetical protein